MGVRYFVGIVIGRGDMAKGMNKILYWICLDMPILWEGSL